MDFFEKVELAPPDPIFGLSIAFKNDTRESKVNLGAGIYKTAELKPLILQTIKEAEARLLEQETSKDYLPIDGLPDYVRTTEQLVFGEVSDRVYGAQTVGGTAALRLGGTFMAQQGYRQLYLSDPTWANHPRIFTHAGLEIQTYPYFDYKKHRFDFEGFYEALNHMPAGSLVLLHACCHNPSGFDPSLEQWQSICERIRTRRLFPFFDFAYQGFGLDPEKDAAAIRLFVREGVQCAVAVSHSKNFGLYAERTGALYFVCDHAQQARCVGSRLKILIRGLYSNPPCHGGKLVAMILQDAGLKQRWLQELTEMRSRIAEMRHMLAAFLIAHSHRFAFLNEQLGMFSYTGLTHKTVERLIAEYGIYLPSDGRINVAGLNRDNLSYVADAIIGVTSG